MIRPPTDDPGMSRSHGMAEVLYKSFLSSDTWKRRLKEREIFWVASGSGQPLLKITGKFYVREKIPGFLLTPEVGTLW